MHTSYDLFDCNLLYLCNEKKNKTFIRKFPEKGINFNRKNENYNDPDEEYEKEDDYDDEDQEYKKWVCDQRTPYAELGILCIFQKYFPLSLSNFPFFFFLVNFVVFQNP